jgi:hypothetical protein
MEILVDDWAEVSEAQRHWLELDYYTNILLMRCRDLVQRGYAVEALAWCDRARTRIAQAGPDAFPGFAVLTDMAHALLGTLVTPRRPWPRGPPSPSMPVTASSSYSARSRRLWSRTSLVTGARVPSGPSTALASPFRRSSPNTA